jgi:predicted amidohydrolase
MKIGFFQYDVIWRDRDANLSYICSKIKDSVFDLLVLPELFTSGYAIIPIRALENQCFVISCNRIGIEMFDGEPESYCGKSQIVNPDGKVLIKADNEEALSIVDIELSEVNNPNFGSLIMKDFVSEHKKYDIKKMPARCGQCSGPQANTTKCNE